MHRIVLTGALALTLAAPALAQTPQAVPGSAEWLRMRGDTYHRAPDAEQNPAEVEATARLNADIAARNQTAAQTEAEAQAAWESENAKWRSESAAAETARAQWEADVAAAEAARAQWERDRAAWEAEVARCRASGRPCVTAPPTAPK
ncbi:hypothetical protein [Brevundimonas viscosa]|uniref:Cell wall hydrolase n=1 Tax=Brevundimonas viscosa TaxID=871741 RepID=A0A1I6NRW9_9CAUL|nr:hypothetical protein [Brevundimonas viscosa]SFS30648.1 hypothetical protein SAMN05192570_0415 [Brevundimonas viscosa]